MNEQAKAPHLCPTCQVPLLAAIRASGATSALDIAFCPRCRYSIELGKRECVAIEVEPDFYLVVSLPPKISAQLAKTIRAVSAPHAAMSATEVWDSLRQLSSIELGPYWAKRDMQHAFNSLQKFDLAIRVDYRFE